MEIKQWPLTAAATHTLLALRPSTAGKGGPAPAPKEVVKLAIKELILRGAYRVELKTRRIGKPKVTVIPTECPALPQPLAELDGYLRPHTPNDLAAAPGARALPSMPLCLYAAAASSGVTATVSAPIRSIG